MRHNTTTTQSPQNKKVGIVIPIYNVAEYLRECLVLPTSGFIRNGIFTKRAGLGVVKLKVKVS